MEPNQAPTRNEIGFITGYLILMFLAMTLAAFFLFQSAERIEPVRMVVSPPAKTVANATDAIRKGADAELVKVVPDSISILLVMLVGGLSALLHSMRSFYFHHAKGDLCRSHLIRYILRPYSGAILAAVFYLIFRAGLSGTEIGESEQGLLLYLALACLVGMFSDQTVAKLKKIAEAIFSKPEQEEDQEAAVAAGQQGQQGQQNGQAGEQPRKPDAE